MRRINFLINQIRESTNNRGKNALSDQQIINYFNLAQDQIQSLIFQSNMENYPFAKEAMYDIVRLQEGYDLPTDTYIKSAIISVFISPNDSIGDGRKNFVPLRNLDVSEQTIGYGYYILNNKFYLTPIPTTNILNGIKMVYTAKIPKLGVRFGTITSFVDGTSVTISDFNDDDITNYGDYFTIVDKDGVIKETDLYISSFNDGTGLISTTTSFSNTDNPVAIGDYVIVGRNSTSHSTLPDACENYLVNYVERKIFLTDSSTDNNVQNIFTSEEKNELINIFSSGKYDASYPPVVDTTYMVY